ncbi:hypothetical protein Slin14017_G123010 [Septoria linicola]|nr:hypothetical protein Slin14017_G123010 [Septoria linicola]
MIHRNDVKFGRPDDLPQARSAPLRGIPTDSFINIHGGQIVKVEGISNSIFDVMVCDYDFCATCNDTAFPMPATSRFENMPFLHLGRDCEPEIDALQHFYTFHGINSAEVAAAVHVSN